MTTSVSGSTPLLRTSMRRLTVYGLDCPAIIAAGVSAMLAEGGGAVEHRLLTGPAPVPPGVDLVLIDVARLGAGIADHDPRDPSRPRIIALIRDPGSYEDWRAHDLGADGSISLALGATELVAALEEEARAVGRPARPPVAATVNRRGDPISLSPRELEILGLICRGLTNAEISAELYLSVNSIKTYIRNAYRKIGVERRSQAVSWGIQQGL